MSIKTTKCKMRVHLLRPPQLWEAGRLPPDPPGGAPLDVPLAAALPGLPPKLCVVDGERDFGRRKNAAFFRVGKGGVTAGRAGASSACPWRARERITGQVAQNERRSRSHARDHRAAASTAPKWPRCARKKVDFPLGSCSSPLLQQDDLRLQPPPLLTFPADYWDDRPKTCDLNAFQRKFDADVHHVWTAAELVELFPTLTPVGRPGEVHTCVRGGGHCDREVVEDGPGRGR